MSLFRQHKRKLLWMLPLGGLLIGISAYVLRGSQLNAMPQNFNRIRLGMNRAEVEAILGPPGDYTTGPTINPVRGPFVGVGIDGPLEEWVIDVQFMIVHFDNDGRVREKATYPNGRLEQGPLDNVVSRAERYWHKWFP